MIMYQLIDWLYTPLFKIKFEQWDVVSIILHDWTRQDDRVVQGRFKWACDSWLYTLTKNDDFEIVHVTQIINDTIWISE